MSIELFVTIISSVLLLTTYALTKRNREEAYALRALQKDKLGIEEEFMVHKILEQIGVLPNHHKSHTKTQRIDRRKLFFVIGYAVIAIELFLIYQAILIKQLSFF